MSTVIGAMEAYLKLNIDDFEKNLQSARKQVESIATGFDALNAVGDKISSVGKGLTLGLTTPIVGVGTACVKTTADFDSAMSKVSAISGATGGDLQKLRDKAKEMGEKTKYSATESAEAFTYMAMAGWDSGQMIDGISGIMNLAAADGLDLATTSDIVTDALTAFGLQAKDSGHFADVLAKASSSANTNVSMLGESFKYVAPVAGSLGYSAEDTAVALGLMANSGIKGSQAGTALRAALTRMVKPTDAAAALMDKYNLSMTNSDGSMKSLGEVMDMLRTNLGGLTEAQQAQVAAELFGQEAMSGMLAIINTSEGDYNKLTDAIANADGTAQNMADTMNDNLQGQLTLLKSQLEGVAIQIGEKLIPHIRKFLTHVSEWIAKFSQLFAKHGDLILAIAGVVAAIGPVLMIVGKAISIYSKFNTTLTNVKAMCTAAGTSLQALATSIGAISAPVLAIVAVIGVLVAAFVHLWNTNEDFRNAITEIWNGIVTKIQDFCQGIVDRLNDLGFNFKDITDVMSSVWNGFCDLLAPVFEGTLSTISALLGTVLDVLTGLLDVFIGVFTGNWEQVWQGVQEIFGGVWDGIKGVLTAALDTLKGLADAFLGWFGTDWDTVWNSIKDFFTGIWDGIKTTFNNFVSWFQNTWNTVKEFLTNTWNGIKSGVTSIVTGFVDGVKNLINGFVTSVTTLFNNLKTGVTNVFNSISSFASSIWTAIKTTVSSLVSGLVSTIQTYFGGMSTSLSNILTGIQTVFSNIWTIIKNVVGGVVLALCDLITLDFNQLKSDMSNIMSNIRDAASNIWNAIKSIITNVATAIRTFLNGAWNLIKNTATSTWNGLKSSVTNIFNGLKSTISNIGNSIKNTLKNVWTSVKSTATSIWNGLKSTANSVWNGIKSTVTSAANGLKSSAISAFNGLKSSASSIFKSIKTTLTNLPNQGKTAAINAFNKMKSGITSAMSGVRSAVVNGMNRAVSYIKSLPSQAVGWGRDMVEGIARGIRGAIGKVTSAASNLAGKIRSYLHFSRPDVGPLRDYEKWMPDMVEGLAKTMTAASPKLTKAAQGVSTALAMVVKKSGNSVSKFEETTGKKMVDSLVSGVNKQKKNAKKSASQLASLYVSAAKQKVDSMKRANRLSLDNEASYWKLLAKHCKKGTDAYKQAIGYMKKAKNSIKDSVNKLTSSFKEDTKSVYDSMKKEVNSLIDTYNNTVKQRAESITGSLSLFEKVNLDEGTSKQDLTANLKSQVNALKEWDATLDKLKSRKEMDANLLTELQNSGVDSLNTLKAISNMSNSELKEYVSLFKQKNAIAKERATTENEALKASTEKSIQKVIKDSNDKMNQLITSFNKSVNKLNISNHMKKELKKASNSMKNIITKSNTWGSDMVNGFASGINKAQKNLNNAVNKMANKIKKILHFSRPDEGPLRDYETWMPDMINGLSATLESSAPTLVDKVRKMTADMQNALTGTDYNVALAGLGGSDIRVGSGMNKNDYSALNRTGQSVVEKTEIHIDRIEVRDDRDLDAVTQGLYNKQDQNLRALGRRNL